MKLLKNRMLWRTALGKVSATGKYKISVQNAADGSQNVVALVVGDSFGTAAPFTVAATTDTKVLVLARGKVVVNKSAIAFDASYDLDAEKQAAWRQPESCRHPR